MNYNLANHSSTPKSKSSSLREFSPQSQSKYSPMSIEKLNISSPPTFNDISGLNFQSSARSISQFAAKIAETDSNTIHRQRKELQLLINELKDRDRELNELVHSHHGELISWETDRKRISSLEKQLSRTKVELRKRHEKCKILKERLQLMQSGVQTKSIELENTQLHLHHVSEKANISSTQVEEFKAKNDKLEKSVQDLSNQVSTIHSRDQEISTLLRLKEKDLDDANNRIDELSEKLQSATKCLYDYKNIDKNMKVELEKSRSDNLSLKEELDKIKSVSSSPMPANTTPEDISDMKQLILHLQKELLLAGEREKRKDSLLELSRSRQERTEAELTHVRQLYKCLQEDYTLMKQKHDPIDDDRMSVLTVSDMDEKDLYSSFLSTSQRVESTNHYYRNNFTNNYNRDKMSSHQHHNKNRSPEIPKSKVLPAPLENIGADISLISLESEDIGFMTPGELKSQDFNDTSRIINDDSFTEPASSPTARLQKLLEESRQMVLNLEKSPPLAIKRSTPDPAKRGEVDEI